MRAHKRVHQPFSAQTGRSSHARTGRMRADAPQQENSSGTQLSQEEMEQKMQDPEVQEKMKQMQEAMKQPEVQQQVQQMQAAMQNQDLQTKLQGLKDDPEFKDMFDDIQKNGMGALMKYYNDSNFLAKLGSRMGDVEVPEAAAQAAPEQPPAPEDLIDAARMGDEEAVEDFIAVGKDVNMRDAEQRTPMHFAAAMDQVAIAKLLMDAGADLSAADSKQNNPLHIAAGYGRIDMTDLLLEKGCDAKAQNASGKTAKDLAGLNEQNPVLQSKELMEKLGA